MKILISVLYAAVCILLIRFILYMFYVFILKPTEFEGVGVRAHSKDYRGNSPRGFEKLKLNIVSVGCLLAMGAAIYGATDLLLSWMPNSWGSYFDDGEFQTTRVTLSGLAAFFGSFLVIHHLTKLASRFHDLDIENAELRHTLTHLTKQIDRIRGYTSRDLALTDLLAKLESESRALEHRTQVSERFKDLPREEIFRRRLGYTVDVNPAIKLVETIRKVIGNVGAQTRT